MEELTIITDEELNFYREEIAFLLKEKKNDEKDVLIGKLAKKYKLACELNNKEDKKKINNIIWESIECYVKSKVSSKCSTYLISKKYDIEEFEGEICSQICTYFQNYNSEIASFVKWCDAHIKHGIDIVINGDTNVSQHYRQNCKLIKKAQMSHPDQKLSPQDLQIITGISLSTIINCLDIMSYSNNEVRLDEEDEDGNKMEISDSVSAEDKYIAEEETRTLITYLSKLPKDEKKVLCLKYGIGCRKAKNNEEIETITGIKKEMIKRLINNGISHLNRSLVKTGLFEERHIVKEISSCNTISFLPQNDEKAIEELQNLFADGEEITF